MKKRKITRKSIAAMSWMVREGSKTLGLDSHLVGMTLKVRKQYTK